MDAEAPAGWGHSGAGRGAGPGPALALPQLSLPEPAGRLDELTDSCAVRPRVQFCPDVRDYCCVMWRTALGPASSLEGFGSQVRPHRRHVGNRMF